MNKKNLNHLSTAYQCFIKLYLIRNNLHAHRFIVYHHPHQAKEQNETKRNLSHLSKVTQKTKGELELNEKNFDAKFRAPNQESKT